MMLELSLTNLIFICIAIFSGVWALIKLVAVMFTRAQQKLIDDIKTSDRIAHALLTERLDALNKMLKEDASQWHRIERELLTLKAELPVHYVRREDYIQAIATILAKLEAMAIRFENLLLKGINREL
jgi:hypothetical protein